jgi:2-hydroxychromene-2-carboxylate isomerase
MIADISNMKKAAWYFDFVSPFAYIGFARLDRLAHKLEIRYRPVLFAGLLNHWEQKGPASHQARLDLSLVHLVGRTTGRRVSFPGCSPLQPSALSPACHSRRQ